MSSKIMSVLFLHYTTLLESIISSTLDCHRVLSLNDFNHYRNVQWHASRSGFGLGKGPGLEDVSNRTRRREGIHRAWSRDRSRDQRVLDGRKSSCELGNRQSGIGQRLERKLGDAGWPFGILVLKCWVSGRPISRTVWI